MKFGSKEIDLSFPHVMGVLNITPDSFSDGGKYSANIDAALRCVDGMVRQGAAFIDVGGESTRPGADRVDEAEELGRVLPVIEKIIERFDVIVSVDTSKPLVMLEAVKVGAGLINDVCALREPGAVEVAASVNVPVCLMHMSGSPRNMQCAPAYDDVVAEVRAFLLQRKEVCVAAGVYAGGIIFDPGFGFGKTLEHNVALMRQLPELCELGSPVLVGVSRKSMLGTITGKPVADRLAAGTAAATYAAMSGAAIVRTHDVDATVDAMKFVRALRG